jgi:integrase
VSQCTPQNLTTYLNRGKPCLKTYNNRRGLISTFFKFCLQQDWVVMNAVEKTPHHRINHRRGSAVTITAERAAELMAFVETFAGGKLVPSFALSLFAGIRPCVRFGEITKLKPKSVRLDTGVIRIEPDVAKVRMPRNVSIQPNLAAWLRAYFVGAPSSDMATIVAGVQPFFVQSCVPRISTGAIAPRALCPDGFITISGASQELQTSCLPTSTVRIEPRPLAWMNLVSVTLTTRASRQAALAGVGGATGATMAELGALP